MKVTTWVALEQEVDVEVSIAAVMSSISALADSDQPGMILDCISSVHRTLREIPQAQIDRMTDAQRDTIAKALHVQAQRYEHTTA